MRRFTAIVRSVEALENGISCIDFTVSTRSFTYRAGQYITVYFDGSSQPAGKAYSLASLPNDPAHRIIVKNIGEFSGRLCALRPGDSFVCSSGYGNFNPHTDRSLVCFAGGVGISPVWSVIRNELSGSSSRHITLVHSHGTLGAVPCHESILHHADTNSQFEAVCHITRQKQLPVWVRDKRIAVSEYVRDSVELPVYVVCGSVDFVRDVWQALAAYGVPPGDVSTETFFE